MSTTRTSCSLMCAAVFAIMVLMGTSVHAGVDYDKHLGLVHLGPSNTCTGSIAECLAVGSSSEEFEMESEISRRILATSKYISYGALQRNTVPCSRRGASYYNCRNGAQANPYSRGCSAITRCRS